MNEILFMIGDLPIRTGAALIGFGALALLLLLIIAIVIARSSRRGAAERGHRPRRRDGTSLGRPSGRDGAGGQRAAGFGEPSRRPIDGTDHA
jgi:hypothetical protein